MRNLLLTLSIVASTLVANAQRYDNYLPENTSVSVAESSLPVIFITADNAVIQRSCDINAAMKIADNYDGNIQIRYTGNSSFLSSEKKPYSIVLGEKKSLLGMKASTNWTLLAPHSDRSLLRTVLSFDLARQFMPCVPEAKLCEVVLDGTYYGVFLLTQTVDDAIPAGSQLYMIDRADGNNTYTSKNKPVGTDGSNKKYASVTYHLLNSAANNTDIIAMETALKGTDYAEQIDETSFADYLLNTEFAHNADGYRLHTYLYKEEGGKFCTNLWATGRGFGNFDMLEGYRNDSWVYNENDILSRQDDPQLVPSFWYNLVHNSAFQSALKARWKEYRQEVFTEEYIYAKIDSIKSLLNSSKALERNFTARPIWNRALWPNYKVTSSYDEEITYLKDWIAYRLTWMDENIGKEESIEPITGYECVPVTIASGFNADCVAESTSTAPTNKSTHPALDGHGSVFITSGVQNYGGLLPDNGEITDTESGHSFQLADYTKDNCLYLDKTGASGTLVFAQPVKADSLCMLLVGTNKENYDLAYTVTVNYTDNTTDPIYMSSVLSDWCNEVFGDFAVRNLDRWRADCGSGCVDGTIVNMSENKLKVNSNKSIQSLTFTSNCQYDAWGYGMVSIFAVSAIAKEGTGIDAVTTGRKEIKSIWSADGKKLNHFEKGINIVRYTDGSSAKILK